MTFFPNSPQIVVREELTHNRQFTPSERIALTTNRNFDSLVSVNQSQSFSAHGPKFKTKSRR